ncbi:MAG: restriction endonuclease subunit S [Schwartzia sp.]|nr:restriction endonuclease subunit S [Schwartzia sp. (in: firmicutes)]
MSEWKDSGIAWIGEIPAEWNTRKLKYCTDFIQEKYNNALGDLSYIGLENVVSGSGKFIETESQYDKMQSLVFQKGDILFGKLRPYLAKVYQCTEQGCCSGEFCVIRPHDTYDIRYFWNLLISSGFIDTVNFSTYGAKMPRANADFIRNIYIPLPPLPEQRRIAAFLDEKCAHIDAIIEKTRASIDEYKKLKQAIITRAVTKGLRQGRKMKDSGIAWIGEIPQEWEARRIKTLFQLRDERNSLPLEQVNLISLYTDKGVMQHSDIEKTTGNKASHADGYKKVYQNDIVVNIILCWMGAIGRSDYDGVTSPAYDVYIPSEEIDSRFYHHYFRTSGFSGDCYKRGKGIMAMRWRTYSDQFRDIRIVMPPLTEQREILAYLDAKTAAIDRLIAKKEQLIAEMQSCKKSLIYEVVTGKREVL